MLSRQHPGELLRFSGYQQDHILLYWVKDATSSRKRFFECWMTYADELSPPGQDDLFFILDEIVYEAADARARLCLTCQHALTCLMNNYQRPRRSETPPFWTPIESPEGEPHGPRG